MKYVKVYEGFINEGKGKNSKPDYKNISKEDAFGGSSPKEAGETDARNGDDLFAGEDSEWKSAVKKLYPKDYKEYTDAYNKYKK